VRADINAHTISLAGRVKGNLTAPGAVVLPAQSRVEGDVRAQSVTVHGAVTGDLVAEQSVRIGGQARVEGDVTCRTLAIEEGAYFAGRSNMNERPAS
jgi:cytoskeletal protein CcmA (bactofilin family)